MTFIFDISEDKGDICKYALLEHCLHVLHYCRLWHLDTYREHPDIVERELTIISSEDVELALHYVGSVPAARAWFVSVSLHLAPAVAINVKNVHIVHPLHTIIATEIVYF